MMVLDLWLVKCSLIFFYCSVGSPSSLFSLHLLLDGKSFMTILFKSKRMSNGFTFSSLHWQLMMTTDFLSGFKNTQLIYSTFCNPISNGLFTLQEALSTLFSALLFGDLNVLPIKNWPRKLVKLKMIKLEIRNKMIWP